MLKQTLRDYMNNPAGKGSTVIPNRQLVIDDFRRRYEKIKEHHKFDVTIYKVRNDYLFHVLVPSEDKDKDIKYDVVLQFTMADEDFSNDINIHRYYVKFFSNSPSFVYTYAYTYNKNGILINELVNKYTDEVIDNPPGTRNPQQIISFEKTIYFACLHLMSSPSYTNKLYLNSHARSLNFNLLVKNVRTADGILMEYKKAQRKKVEKEKKESKPISKPISRGTTTSTKTNVKKKTVTPKKKPIKKIAAKKSTIKGKK